MHRDIHHQHWAFAKGGMVDKAEELFNHMCECNVKPDVVIYHGLDNACARAGMPGRAVGWTQVMAQQGLTAGEETHNSITNAWALSEGDALAAHAAVDDYLRGRTGLGQPPAAPAAGWRTIELIRALAALRPASREQAAAMEHREEVLQKVTRELAAAAAAAGLGNPRAAQAAGWRPVELIRELAALREASRGRAAAMEHRKEDLQKVASELPRQQQQPGSANRRCRRPVGTTST